MLPSNEKGSKRWKAFHAALNLAIQRAANKWSYDDFAESFSVWCDEQPESAKQVFNAVSRHMEDSMTDACNDKLEKDNIQDAIDVLHAVNEEARARNQRGEIGSDIWQEHISPRAAVRARTVPVLEREAARLRETLAQLEQENRELHTSLQKTEAELDSAEDETVAILDALDEAFKSWSGLPIGEMEVWSTGRVDVTSPPIPSA